MVAIAFQGVTGALSYDASHNPIKSAVVMKVHADGAHFFVLIPPPTSKPRLAINHNNGSPGSYFTLMGAHFPPRRTGTISINGSSSAAPIAVDAVGGVVFRLDTAEADEGRYFVTVSVNPSVTASFMLDRSYPQRPSEGSGEVIVVPAGIAYTEFVHLPSVRR